MRVSICTWVCRYALCYFEYISVYEEVKKLRSFKETCKNQTTESQGSKDARNLIEETCLPFICMEGARSGRIGFSRMVR